MKINQVDYCTRHFLARPPALTGELVRCVSVCNVTGDRVCKDWDFLRNTERFGPMICKVDNNTRAYVIEQVLIIALIIRNNRQDTTLLGNICNFFVGY